MKPQTRIYFQTTREKAAMKEKLLEETPGIWNQRQIMYNIKTFNKIKYFRAVKDTCRLYDW